MFQRLNRDFEICEIMTAIYPFQLPYDCSCELVIAHGKSDHWKSFQEITIVIEI
jgi:hypothetical protein